MIARDDSDSIVRRQYRFINTYKNYHKSRMCLLEAVIEQTAEQAAANSVEWVEIRLVQ